MTPIERGTVNYYNPDRQFGFIVSNSGQKIFFHFNNGKAVKPAVMNNCEPEWTNAKLRTPHKGDRVVFRSILTDDMARQGKDPKADPWTFESDWDNIRSGRFGKPVETNREKALEGYCPVCREAHPLKSVEPKYPDDPMLQKEHHFMLDEHKDLRGRACLGAGKHPTAMRDPDDDFYDYDPEDFNSREPNDGEDEEILWERRAYYNE